MQLSKPGDVALRLIELQALRPLIDSKLAVAAMLVGRAEACIELA